MASAMLSQEMNEEKEIIQFKKGGTRIIERIHDHKDSPIPNIKNEIDHDKRGFLVTVHHHAEDYGDMYDDKDVNEQIGYDNIEYGTAEYTQIVSKEQRPFDAFSFFVTEIFFLDVI
eukprot:UN10392